MADKSFTNYGGGELTFAILDSTWGFNPRNITEDQHNAILTAGVILVRLEYATPVNTRIYTRSLITEPLEPHIIHFYNIRGAWATSLQISKLSYNTTTRTFSDTTSNIGPVTVEANLNE